MRPTLFSSPITFAAARDALAAHVRQVDRVEAVPVDACAGRVSAADVTADSSIPPYERSAMDGYAVAAVSEPSGERMRWECVGRVAAGDWPTFVLDAGQCAEIATGAPLPAGTVAVVMVEHTTVDDRRVALRPGHELVPGQHILPRGSDVASGHVAVRKGDLLTPARVGVLAALGRTHVDVFSRPSVAILSTGSELGTPGTVLEPGQIYEVNSTTLSALVAAHGGRPVPLPAVSDSVDAVSAALCSAASHDLIVCSGGSSVGTRDLLTDAIHAAGGRIVFHGVAIKPGKPTLFGFIDETPLFGMPGNPTSCLSNAYLLLLPYLRHAARLPAWRPWQQHATLSGPVISAADRHQFFAVRLEADRAVPAFKNSNAISSLADADGYIEIPVGVSRLEEGTPVIVTLF